MPSASIRRPRRRSRLRCIRSRLPRPPHPCRRSSRSSRPRVVTHRVRMRRIRSASRAVISRTASAVASLPPRPAWSRTQRRTFRAGLLFPARRQGIVGAASSRRVAGEPRRGAARLQCRIDPPGFPRAAPEDERPAAHLARQRRDHAQAAERDRRHVRFLQPRQSRTSTAPRMNSPSAPPAPSRARATR